MLLSHLVDVLFVDLTAAHLLAAADLQARVALHLLRVEAVYAACWLVKRSHRLFRLSSEIIGEKDGFLGFEDVGPVGFALAPVPVEVPAVGKQDEGIGGHLAVSPL